MYNVRYREAAVYLVHFFGIRGTASMFKASPSSICRWVKSIDPKEYKKRQSIITDDVSIAIGCFIKTNPQSRARDIVEFIALTFGFKVSRSLIQITLVRLGITYKRAQTRARNRNPGPEYDSRVSRFCKLFKDNYDRNNLLVSIDESAIDERSRPESGYAFKGERVVFFNPPVSKLKVTRLTLLMAIANNGSNTYTLSEHATDANTFADFILQLPYPPNTSIVMDNLSVHDVINVQVAMDVKGYKPIFTPPQSPEFNPIEMLFGTVKNKFKKQDI